MSCQMLEAVDALDRRQLDSGKDVRKIGVDVNTNDQETEKLEAMDLSIRNNFGAVGVKLETVGESSSSNCSNSNDKFAGSMLYQIMIDPTFVENIKNTKNMKNLTCKFCKEQFESDDALGKHLDARLNELDNITCCACGKTFGQKRYLRYHQRCHVKKNQFTCGICTKIYSRMDNLTRHKAYHTNPDKYPCTMCKKAFSRRDLMMKHLKSHQGKKMNCNLCKGVFAGLAEMEAHRIALHSTKKKN